ncbi:hypothetical protein LCGC14_1675570 [marine sediment metagenome]|uniref:Uncharacterized protein n=1 Tax=marine sediment metagenome TaxID=412755 RepID=A0A0F9K5T5_9ZZZZ
MALNNAPDSTWTGELVLAPQTDNDGNVIGGGLVLPAITTTERDAIASPRSGTLIYNSTTNKANLRVAAAWEAITSA